MWVTILIILVILILILSIMKIWLDLKSRKPRGFIIKEGIFLFLLATGLLLIDIRCAREADVPEKEEQAPQLEEEIGLESDPAKRLLAQLQDYIDGLDKSDKPQLKLYFKEGMEYRIKEDYSNALETFRQGLNLNLKDSEKIALYILMGNASAFLQKYEDADYFYYEAVTLSEDIKNDTGLAVSLINLALLYQIAEDWDKALNTYFKLLEVFKRMEDEQAELNTYANIGMLYQMKGNLDSASFYQQKSAKIGQDRGALIAKAAQLNNQALIHKSQGNLDSALVLHQEALKIFQQIRDKKSEASVLGNIGLVFQEKGDLAKALEYHQKALSIDSTIAHTFGEAGDLTNIGSVYEQMKDYPKALEFYQKSLSLFEKIEAKKESDFVKENIKRVEDKIKI
jgi:tetratricopeptide (TPR) repeat protein